MRAYFMALQLAISSLGATAGRCCLRMLSEAQPCMDSVPALHMS